MGMSMRRDQRQERFESLVTANRQDLLRYALRRTETPADAADCVAETRLIAWRRVAVIPPGHEARLWLFGVARRVLANHRRGHRRRLRLAERLTSELGAAAPSTADRDSELLDALDTLSASDRELIRLASWEGLTGPEIAAVLQIGPDAVRTRLRRARQRVRDALGHTVVPMRSVEECS